MRAPDRVRFTSRCGYGYCPAGIPQFCGARVGILYEVVVRLTNKQKVAIVRIVKDAVKQVLRFQVAYDLTQYLSDKTHGQWVDLASALHNQYPLKGMGLIADTKALDCPDGELRGQVIFDEVDLAPETAIEQKDDYPLAAASLAYIFTILEIAGDEVAAVINGVPKKGRSSWHSRAYGDLDINDRAKVDAVRDAFSKDFKVPVKRWKRRSIARLVWLKAQRNAFAHERVTNVDYARSVDFTLMLLVQLASIADPNGGPLKVYPFEDYHGQFS